MTEQHSITSNQRKQVQRFAEDGVDRALEQLGLNKEGLQRVIERGGELQQGILDLFARLSKPKLIFQHNKSEDGWELLEDVGFTPALTSPAQLELVSFLEDNESYVNGETMLQRARGKLNANLGQQHAEWLLEHQVEIPEEFKEHYLAFTGTVWHRPHGRRHVPCDGWRLNFRWLGNHWDGIDRLVRLHE